MYIISATSVLYSSPLYMICMSLGNKDYFIVIVRLFHAEWRIYVSATKDISGSDNGLAPNRRRAIMPTKAGILSIEPLGTNSEILTEIKNFYSRRGIWKCCQRNCGHFISASMCLKNVLGHPMSLSVSTIVSPLLMHWIDRCIETALWVWIAECCLFLKIGDLVLTWPEISQHWQFTPGWMANFKKL